MRRAAACLILLALCGCSARPDSAGGAGGDADLRARVERLERDTAEDRERLATELSALRDELAATRAELERAERQVAEVSGKAPEAEPAQAQQHKSPRAALRESLKGAVDSSRRAMERLNRELERALSRSRRHEATPQSSAPKETAPREAVPEK